MKKLLLSFFLSTGFFSSANAARTSAVTSGSGSGGGGSSTLQISLNGIQTSSPTATVNFSSAFTATQSPTGQANIGINFSSVTSGGIPGGANSNVQINHPTGTFYGDSGFQYDPSVSSVTVIGNLGVNGIIGANQTYGSSSAIARWIDQTAYPNPNALSIFYRTNTQFFNANDVAEIQFGSPTGDWGDIKLRTAGLGGTLADRVVLTNSGDYVPTSSSIPMYLTSANTGTGIYDNAGSAIYFKGTTGLSSGPMIFNLDAGVSNPTNGLTLKFDTTGNDSNFNWNSNTGTSGVMSFDSPFVFLSSTTHLSTVTFSGPAILSSILSASSLATDTTGKIIAGSGSSGGFIYAATGTPSFPFGFSGSTGIFSGIVSISSTVFVNGRIQLSTYPITGGTIPGIYSQANNLIGINLSAASSIQFQEFQSAAQYSAMTITPTEIDVSTHVVITTGSDLDFQDTLGGKSSQMFYSPTFSGITISTGVQVQGNLTITALTSGQCVQTGTNGLLTVTGAACGSGGAAVNISSGPVFASTNTTTVTNSTVETSLRGIGYGSSTFTANSLYVGETLLVAASGLLSDAATLQGTLTIKFKLGGSTVAVTTAFTPTANQSNSLWSFLSYLTVRSIGSNGSVISNNSFVITDSLGITQDVYPMANTASIPIDTTKAVNDVDLTATWGSQSASNIITCTNFIVDNFNGNAAAGGSGTSTLAIGTGTASNFTTSVTNSVTALSFLGSQFGSTTNGTTNFVFISPASNITVTTFTVTSSATMTNLNLISNLVALSSVTTSNISIRNAGIGGHVPGSNNAELTFYSASSGQTNEIYFYDGPGGAASPVASIIKQTDNRFQLSSIPASAPPITIYPTDGHVAINQPLADGFLDPTVGMEIYPLSGVDNLGIRAGIGNMLDFFSGTVAIASVTAAATALFPNAVFSASVKIPFAPSANLGTDGTGTIISTIPYFSKGITATLSTFTAVVLTSSITTPNILVTNVLSASSLATDSTGKIVAGSGGAPSVIPQIVTTSLTLTSTMTVVLASCPASTNLTLTLPASASNSGFSPTIYKADSTTQTISIITTGSDLIVTTGTIIMRAKGQNLSLLADGVASYIARAPLPCDLPYIGIPNAGTTAGQSINSSNRAYFVAIYVAQPTIAYAMRLHIGGQSGNIDVGIYDQNLNRITSSSNTACPAPGAAVVNFLTPAVLAAGSYYLALAADNSTATFGGSSAMNPQEAQFFHATNYPLPATTSALTAADRGFSIIGLVYGGVSQ